MSRPAINNTRLNEHLTLSECHPDSECRSNNWWLYDSRAGMNIGMRAVTRDAAFVEAIEYWARRALKSEVEHADILSKVESFVGQFRDADDDDDD